jgi:hypothetical protein
MGTGGNINKASNAFLVNPDVHLSFDAFKFGIKADTSKEPTLYTPKAFASRALSPVIRRKAENKARIDFGHLNLQDFPDSYLCNIHHALGRFLHASSEWKL